MALPGLAVGAVLSAQVPTTPAAAALVVGSGNFFSPIVANLERAVGFYHEGLGLEVMGAPSNADTNAPLRNMFGLPDARLRWTVARPAGARQGVEIVEITNAGGRAAKRDITDPGAVTLIMPAAEKLTTMVERLTKNGGTLLTARGKGSLSSAHDVVLRDPDDHFVELVATGQPLTPTPPRIRLTVHDVKKATNLYRDVLGLRATTSPPTSDEWLTAVIGLKSGGTEAAVLQVPGSDLVIEFVHFAGKGGSITARIQDPGSTRLQLQVRDLDAAIRAVVAAGGQVISTGGQPVEMPAGRGAPIRAAIVRDPDNLFLVLIAAPR